MQRYHGNLWITIAGACLLTFGLAQGSLAENGKSELKTLFEAEQYDEARELGEKRLAANEQDEKAIYWLGRVAFETGEHKDSAEYFEDLVALNNSSSDYYLWLGRAHGLRARHSNMLVKGRLAPKIRDAFERSVELDGTNIEARKGLVQYYAEAPGFLGGDIDKAFEQAEAVKQLDETEGHVSYGNVYFQQKEYENARQSFERAVAGGTEDGPAYASLGDIYRMNGDNAEAKKMYEKALEYDKGNVEAKEGLEKL